MKHEKLFIIVGIYAALIALLDIAYLIVFGITMSNAAAGEKFIEKSFLDFSIAAVVLNVSLIVVYVLYLILRKKFIKK